MSRKDQYIEVMKCINVSQEDPGLDPVCERSGIKVGVIQLLFQCSTTIDIINDQYLFSSAARVIFRLELHVVNINQAVLLLLLLAGLVTCGDVVKELKTSTSVDLILMISIQ